MSSGSGAREARRSRRALAVQQRKENARLAEADSEIARRRLSSSSRNAGRQSLIATSPTGLATNLGGTVNA